MNEKIAEIFNNPGQILDLALPYLGKFFVALILFIIGRWIAKRIVSLLDRLMKNRQVDETLRDFICTILSLAFTFVVALAALEQLGINTTSFLALLGAAGLAIGLALKDSLSNFAAGVMIMVQRPFKAEDYIQAAGIEGSVESVNIFSTILRTPDNKSIIVPNNQIYSDTITNYSTRARRRVDLVIGIGYSDDIRHARDVIMTLLNGDERILADPEPIVALGELGESSVNLFVRPWVKTEDYLQVKFDLLEEIKQAFDQQGISIPYPQRDIHFYKQASTDSDHISD